MIAITILSEKSLYHGFQVIPNHYLVRIGGNDSRIVRFPDLLASSVGREPKQINDYKPLPTVAKFS